MTLDKKTRTAEMVKAFSEIQKELEMTARTLDYHLFRLRNDGIVRKDVHANGRSIFSRQNAYRVILATATFSLGFVSSTFMYEWLHLNVFFKEYPLLFWLASLSLALIGIILALISLMKKAQSIQRQ